MATRAQWLAGARPRTLPAAVAPVLAGTGVAAYADGVVWWKALLALVVSLALQVAVNYANDYSDGIRGTDDDRVGPMRLVGSGAAPAGAVKRAAFAGVRRRRRSRGWCSPPPPRGGWSRSALVCVRRRVVLHRRLQALRLPRARRGHGVRVLRPGRGDRHDLRADRVLAVAGAVRRRGDRCAGLRDPGGQQPARHPDRHRRRQADPRRTPRRPAGPAGSTRYWSWPPRPPWWPWLSRPPGGRCVGLGFLVVGGPGRPGRARRCRSAPRWSRCSSRPVSPSSSGRGWSRRHWCWPAEHGCRCGVSVRRLRAARRVSVRRLRHNCWPMALRSPETGPQASNCSQPVR